mgnify:CR=1 FL=1
MPLGGMEETGGYKGYGLCFMVEILCGILAGSNYGHHIRTWQTSSGEANLVSYFKKFRNIYYKIKFIFRVFLKQN